MPGGMLPRKDSELVILRVAHLSGSAYEFEHHTRLGRKVGLTDADIASVTRPTPEGTWSDRHATLLAATDQLHATRNLDDATWARLRSHLDERRCIEFLMLIGHYEMLATFLTTLRVQPDPPSGG